MLHEMDMKALWDNLDHVDMELHSEVNKLNTIRENMNNLRESLEEENERLAKLPEFDFLLPSDVIYFNIGGQLFDIPVSILTRDPSSILAVCCRRSCHYIKDNDSHYFFDRDWWLFRLIVSFLRSKILPSDNTILKELYREAIFYRISDLIVAIENLRSTRVLKNTHVSIR